ncbi:unnamed protein product [Arabis nemorensis]|uniref:Uncharacterized protein n=1 Tax=Arabis nemorensis TaxID=586526 RepID=A0A565B195_9BRAS|nr:unnamed protein product [Arabis nemorensis]
MKFGLLLRRVTGTLATLLLTVANRSFYSALTLHLVVPIPSIYDLNHWVPVLIRPCPLISSFVLRTWTFMGDRSKNQGKWFFKITKDDTSTLRLFDLTFHKPNSRSQITP